MGSLTLALIGLASIVSLGGLAAALSARSRRQQPFVPGMHILRRDVAHDPTSGPMRSGCASLEIGVWLDNAGRLQVGSRPNGGGPGGAIGPLVLRSLADRARSYGGPIRTGGPHEPVTLMIEILESDPDRQASAYEELDAALRAYPNHWTHLHDGVVTPGAVTVALTGVGVPRQMLAAQNDRYVFCDGGFGDIGAWGSPIALVPMVSEHWSWRFGWKGVHEIPADERALLRQLVAAAHADGRRVRLYGIPERGTRVREAFWRELIDAGVDVISTARPRQFAAFLRDRRVAVTGKIVRCPSSEPWDLDDDSSPSERGLRAASAR